MEPIRPPPEIVTIDPPACDYPDPPKGVDLSSLHTEVGPVGMEVRMSFQTWQNVLRRDLRWQELEALARLCKVPRK